MAQEVSAAQLIVQNGVGYDSWMNKIESASPNPERKVITVQQVLGLPDSTPNPHLWYDPATMPAVAKVMAADLSALQPAHKAYFQASLKTFDRSLAPWLTAIAQFKAKYPGTTAATTEPVADYLLTAMGITNLTPFRFQADIMNGVDPAPQDIALENSFFTGHKVKAVRLQPAGDRRAHHLDPGQCPQGRGAGGRRLRDHARPAMTTSPGCSPR